MSVSRWPASGVFNVCMSAWGFVMVVGGMLAILEWPERFPPLGRSFYVLGAGLLAAGEFVFAVTASRMFPRASAWLTGAAELLPWAVLVIVLAGVLLWGV